MRSLVVTQTVVFRQYFRIRGTNQSHSHGVSRVLHRIQSRSGDRRWTSISGARHAYAQLWWKDY